MFKKFISVFLICALILSMSVSALATDDKKSSDGALPEGIEMVSELIAPGCSSVEIAGETIAQDLSDEAIDIDNVK